MNPRHGENFSLTMGEGTVSAKGLFEESRLFKTEVKINISIYYFFLVFTKIEKVEENDRKRDIYILNYYASKHSSERSKIRYMSSRKN